MISAITIGPTIVINPRQYGAKGDCVALTGLSMSSGSHTVTGHTCTAVDIGKVFVVKGALATGGGVHNSTLRGTVLSLSSGNAVLDTAATATASGVAGCLGTDDGPAIQVAIGVANPIGGAVYLPSGGYLLHTGIQFSRGNVAFYGDGPGRTVLYCALETSSFSISATFDGTLDAASWKHFEFRGYQSIDDASAQGRGLIYLDQAHGYATNVVLDDVFINGCGLTGITWEPKSSRVSNVVTRNCDEHGMYVVGAGVNNKIDNFRAENPSLRSDVHGACAGLKLTTQTGLIATNVHIVLGRLSGSGLGVFEDDDCRDCSVQSRITLDAPDQIACRIIGQDCSAELSVEAGLALDDLSITINTKTLHSASVAATSDDVGKTVYVAGAVIGLSVVDSVSGGNWILHDNATATVSGATGAIGWTGTKALRIDNIGAKNVVNVRVFGGWVGNPIDVVAGASDNVLSPKIFGVVGTPSSGAVTCTGTTRTTLHAPYMFHTPIGVSANDSVGFKTFGGKINASIGRYGTSGATEYYIHDTELGELFSGRKLISRSTSANDPSDAADAIVQYDNPNAAVSAGGVASWAVWTFGDDTVRLAMGGYYRVGFGSAFSFKGANHTQGYQWYGSIDNSSPYAGLSATGLSVGGAAGQASTGRIEARPTAAQLGFVSYAHSGQTANLYHAIDANGNPCWSVAAGGHMNLPELADPAAAPADSGYLYVRDNGSGKSQLVAKFHTGAVQVIATEP